MNFLKYYFIALVMLAGFSLAQSQIPPGQTDLVTKNCGAYAVPLFENFDGVTAPNLPDCWGGIAVHPSANPYVRTIVTSDPFSFPNHVAMYNSATYSPDASVMLISPEIATDLNLLQVTFYARRGTSAESLIIGTMQDHDDVTRFVQVAQIQLTPAYAYYSISLENYSGANKMVAFKHANTVASRYIYIDDVRIEEIPSCPYPTNLTVTDIMTTSAVIGWSPGGVELMWNVKYGFPGFDPALEGTLVSNITSVPYTLENLSFFTNYEFYVQAICDPDDLSPWEGPKGFKTASNALIGEYTINSFLPTGGTNFNSFTDFATAVNDGGCMGTVIVNVVKGSGPYTEQIILGEFPNSSADNNLIINGNGEVLQFLSTTNDQRATLKMDGTDYVTIDNLIIKALGSGSGQYGYGVQLMNGADFNTFTNCQFIAETTSSTIYFGNNYAAFVTSNNPINALSAGLAASNLTVENCIITGGDPAIVINGPTVAQGAPFSENNVIRNNQIQDFYRYGLYLRGQNNSIFENNEISRPNRENVSISYLIYFTQDMTGSLINSNRIFDIGGKNGSSSSTYAIYSTGATAQEGNELIVSNNLVYGFDKVDAVHRGFQLANTTNVKIYHNTVFLDNVNHVGSHAVRGLHHSGANSKIDVRNNIFSIISNTTGVIHGLYFTTNTATVTTDNNVFHLGSPTGTSHIGFWNGASYTSLNDWQALGSGTYDRNSIATDPIFTDPFGVDLTPLNFMIDNIGADLLTDVPFDFFGEPRTTTPDPGAIEFTPPVLGVISGFVTEVVRNAVQDARIFFNDYETFSDDNGYYEFQDILPGLYTITCEAEGFLTQVVVDFEVVSGEINQLDFLMEFAQIVVTPESIQETLPPGGMSVKELTIANPGGTGPLSWTSSIVATTGNRFPGNTSQIEIINNPNADDRNPDTKPGEVYPSRNLFDLQGFFPVFDPDGTYSVATDGRFIYTGRWNENQYNKYTMDGAHIESFLIPGAGFTRDLAFDGQYFYGSPNSTTIYQMDFDAKTLVASITAPSMVRGIAYDSNNDGFWVTSGWNPPVQLINRAGAVLQSLSTEVISISGLAWENVTDGSPYLWAYAQTQGTSLNNLVQVDITTGATLQSFDVANTGVINVDFISGGMEITDKIIPGVWTFVGCAQNDVVWILELKSWLSLNPSSGIVLPGESSIISLHFDASELPVDSYFANINIDHDGNIVRGDTITIPVELTVETGSLPEPPFNPDPPVNATLVSLQPVFTWTNGVGTQQSKIAIRKGGQLGVLIHETDFFTGNSFDLASVSKILDKKSTNVWQVTCKNSLGETKGPWWSFETIGEGNISGLIVDGYSGEPLEGVQVTVNNDLFQTLTGADGTFLITGIPEGDYLVKAALDDYVSQTQEVTVAHSQTAIANFNLLEYLLPPTFLQATIEDFVNVKLEWQPPVIYSPLVPEFRSLPATWPEPTVEQEASDYAESNPPLESIPLFIPDQMLRAANVLYDNGPLLTGECASTSDPESMMQPPTTVFGVNFNQAGSFSVADDFYVPEGMAWSIETVEFFGYQTNSPPITSFTGAYLRIWNGNPMNGGEVIWGDLTTNLIASTAFTGIYRVSSTTSCNTTRPLMSIIAETPGLILPAGNYWIEWCATGSVTSGPWSPTVSYVGQTFEGYNGLQNNASGVWSEYLSNGVNVEWPFILSGANVSGALPENLIGFNIYRNGDEIAYLPVDRSYEYTDGPLAIGEYHYEVTAVYGFGTPGESDPAGPVSVTIVPLPEQIITLPEGWSGWSSYIAPPGELSFAEVVNPVLNNMVITQHFTDLFYPAFNINTFGLFSNHHGYVSKMNAESLLTIEGGLVAPVINLYAGWNLMPVPAQCNLAAIDVFGAISNLIIAYEVAGNGIYYPDGNVYTLSVVVPGRAYWVKVGGDSQFTFPSCDNNLKSEYMPPLRAVYTTNWNEVNFTAKSHVIVFDKNATKHFVQGDVIGAFTSAGICAGMAIVQDAALSLVAFADDFTVSGVTGFDEGEKIGFKLFRPGNDSEFDLTVNYSDASPNAGFFADHGLSIVDDVSMNSTGVFSTQQIEISIYPMPSDGLFNVHFRGENVIDFEIADATGNVFRNGNFVNNTKVDLSNMPKGVYFMKFSTNKYTIVRKLIKM